MTQPRWYSSMVFLLAILVISFLAVGCSPPLPNWFLGGVPSSASSIAPDIPRSEILAQSWEAYKQQFIQADGRVIDREADDRTVSEGQAYAMLRAVFIDDPETFARTLEWAESNLQRRTTDGESSDTLWAWKWGKSLNDRWEIIDQNFASDADIDAITALILAARRWNRPDYLTLAQTKLRDLWELSTLRVPATNQRYLLPGPAESFIQSDRLTLNPSYLAPYAFRLFAQIDPERDWLSLVDSSYQILSEVASLSPKGLPGDWVVLNLGNRRLEPTSLRGTDGAGQSVYGFDAYRVWWRVAIDAVWFEEDRAQTFLATHLQPLRNQWQFEQKIPARMNLRGEPIVTYESTAQYGLLYAAFSLVDPTVATAMQQQKLLPTYREGIWDRDDAYYTQNLCWFGLAFPYETITDWLNPEASA